MRSFTRRAAALTLSAALSAATAAAQAPPATLPPTTPVATPPAAATPAPPTTPPALKPEPRPTGTAAKVNGQEIPEVAVWRALRQFPAEERDVARKEIINHLVENTLIDQYLTALKVTAKPEDVEKVIADLKDDLKKFGKEYGKELEAMLLTEEEFRTEVTAQMKWDNFLKDRATDDELKKMFEAAPTMFDGSMVRASHILLTPGEDPTKQAEAVAKLRKIKADVEAAGTTAAAALPATATPLEKEQARVKGATTAFAGYAKTESTCPSKKEGGDLNFFPRVGQMVEPFAKAAFDLNVGQMSEVVATEFGYHLILVTVKNPGKTPAFAQAKEAVRAVYAMRLRDAVIAQMKPKAKLEVMPAPAAAAGAATLPTGATTGVPMAK